MRVQQWLYAFLGYLLLHLMPSPPPIPTADAATSMKSLGASVSFQNGDTWGCRFQGLICVPTNSLLVESGFGKEMMRVRTSSGNTVKVTIHSTGLMFVGNNATQASFTVPGSGVLEIMFQSDDRGIKTIVIENTCVSTGQSETFTKQVVSFILKPDHLEVETSHPEPTDVGTPGRGDRRVGSAETTPGFAPAATPQPNIVGKTAFWPTENISVELHNPSGSSYSRSVKTFTGGKFRVIAEPEDPCTRIKLIKADVRIRERVRLTHLMVAARTPGGISQIRWTGTHEDLGSLPPPLTLPAIPDVNIVAARADTIPVPPPQIITEQEASDVFSLSQNRTAEGPDHFFITSAEVAMAKYLIHNTLHGALFLGNGTARGTLKHFPGEGLQVDVDPKCPEEFIH